MPLAAHLYQFHLGIIRDKSESRGHRSRLAFLFPFLLLFPAITGTAHAQTLAVTSNGSTVNSGGTLLIDNSPLMPPLSLEVTGACGTVNYSITFGWFAQNGTATGTDVSGASTSGNFACGQVQTIDWSNIPSLEGGTTSITWSVTSSNGTTSGSQVFQFTVLGENPCYSDVDSFAQFPWFFRYVLMQESSYQQFSASTNCPGQIGGNPLYGAPDGFGLGQLEAGARFSGDDDFWNWPVNVLDSATLLENYQTKAYTSWSNEYNQMVQTTGGNPQYPNNDAPLTFKDCTFVCTGSSCPAQGSNSYGDADWINTYNHGTGPNSFYIFWTPPSNGNPGSWEIEHGYVDSVCGTSPP